MPYELFLSWRHLRSGRKRPLARVTALVAVIGIAVGVAALIVALALANGFRDEMRDKILRGTAHVSIIRADGKPMGDYRELVARLKTLNGVTDATGTTYDGAVVVGPKGSAYAVLRGIDPDSTTVVSQVSRTLVAGSISPVFERKEGEPPNVVVGSELAAKTGVAVDDVFDLVLANPSLASNEPVKRFVRVAGIFRSELFEYDSTWVYLSLQTAATFGGATDSASVISLHVKDIYEVNEVTANARSSLGSSYSVVDWQEANRPLFTALALERRMGFVIIGLIILIAALNITTALILVVVERRREIAILNALGSTRGSIMGIFLVEGALIGIIGAGLGVTLGALACVLGNHYKLVSLPADVYSISNVPFHIHFRDVTVAALVALLLSLLATIYPARAAARVRPVEILRDAQ